MCFFFPDGDEIHPKTISLYLSCSFYSIIHFGGGERGIGKRGIISSLSFPFPDGLIFKDIYSHLLGICPPHSLSTASSVGFLWHGGVTSGSPEL